MYPEEEVREILLQMFFVESKITQAKRFFLLSRNIHYAAKSQIKILHFIQRIFYMIFCHPYKLLSFLFGQLFFILHIIHRKMKLKKVFLRKQ